MLARDDWVVVVKLSYGSWERGFERQLGRQSIRFINFRHELESAFPAILRQFAPLSRVSQFILAIFFIARIYTEAAVGGEEEIQFQRSLNSAIRIKKKTLRNRYS